MQSIIDWFKKLFHISEGGIVPTPVATQPVQPPAPLPLPAPTPRAPQPEDMLPPPGTSPVALAQLQDNAAKYLRCTMDPNELAELKEVCDQIEAIEKKQKLYSNLEAKTGVERWAISGLHYREASLSMLGCLHNGDRVIGPDAMARNLKTTHVPAGLGPWPDFESSAVDAILRELKSKGWKAAPIGVADTTAFTERYNGLGPRNHGIDSGYNWGGTSEEDLGGYSNDGVWDARRVETRIGVVAIMKEMQRREVSKTGIPDAPPEVINHPSAQVYEKLRALAKTVGLQAAPVEELIAFHSQYHPDSVLRYWAVVDFSQHSSKKRFYLLDTVAMNVEQHLVSHGAGSDPGNTGYPTKFSNTDGSHMSSLGILKCAELYQSMGETRMRYDGLQNQNSNVRGRAIVMHSASYVNESSGTCGRSWGCTVLDPKILPRAVQALHGGSLLNIWKV